VKKSKKFLAAAKVKNANTPASARPALNEQKITHSLTTG
jgi:hypothetical protein